MLTLYITKLLNFFFFEKITIEKLGRSDALLDSKKETEEILNAILPPRCWEEDGQLWTQTVCQTYFTE